MAELAIVAGAALVGALTAATVTATTTAPATTTDPATTTVTDVNSWSADTKTEWINKAMMKCNQYPMNVLKNVYTNTDIYTIANSNNCTLIHQPSTWSDNERSEWSHFVRTKCNATGIDGLSNDDIFTFSKDCPTTDKIPTSTPVKNYWTNVAKMNCPGVDTFTDTGLMSAIANPPRCPTVVPVTVGGTQPKPGLHIFIQDGTFEVKGAPVTAKVLVVGGGASGLAGGPGRGAVNGGSAGGVTYSENVKLAPGVYDVKVGNGGEFGSTSTRMNISGSGSGKLSSITGPGGVSIVAQGGPFPSGNSPDGFKIDTVSNVGFGGRGGPGSRGNGNGTSGGAGFQSDISGSWIEYGTGGGGGGASGGLPGWPNGGSTWGDGTPGKTPGSGGGGGGQNASGQEQPGAKGIVIIKI